MMLSIASTATTRLSKWNEKSTTHKDKSTEQRQLTAVCRLLQKKNYTDCILEEQRLKT